VPVVLPPTRLRPVGRRCLLLLSVGFWFLFFAPFAAIATAHIPLRTRRAYPLLSSRQTIIGHITRRLLRGTRTRWTTASAASARGFGFGPFAAAPYGTAIVIVRVGAAQLDGRLFAFPFVALITITIAVVAVLTGVFVIVSDGCGFGFGIRCSGALFDRGRRRSGSGCSSGCGGFAFGIGRRASGCFVA
jgi:hypothetical protein